MVQNYAIAQAHSIAELITKVNAMINLGWQPQGSIAVDPVNHLYLQAMWTSVR